MSLALVDDLELVRRFVAGEQDCFVEIVRRHRPDLSTFVFHQLRNAHDAEETVQDVFIRAHRCLVRFRGDSMLKTWLFRVATNLCRNKYWHGRVRRKHLMDSLDFPLGEPGGATLGDIIASEAMSAADEIELEEIGKNIGKAMAKLPPIFREIMDKRVVEHRSYEEIAAHFNIKVGTVKSRIARARECLRAELAPLTMEAA